MLKKVVIASLLMGAAAMGSVSPAVAADPAPPADAAGGVVHDVRHTIGRCSPGLLFDSSKLTCNYAGLVNPNGPS
ncbi:MULTISPECIES: hypothetical protein [Streptomyces]|uniref:Uncharacterized protein n=1 Tax=Streptomyces glycanivorans TaxID=3033808 RepID=A0ABY9JRG5_9ACTN|nr:MULTISPECIES: hypothetical protein [unclassified Streptomyces]WLQ69179.1 hypothetical protein P8A20_37185 [Streptomyces sp. Alt3]WSR53545.1 hypothetical protein OG279_38970 [Streptomyces sp. NBC_01201]